MGSTFETRHTLTDSFPRPKHKIFHNGIERNIAGTAIILTGAICEIYDANPIKLNEGLKGFAQLLQLTPKDVDSRLRPFQIFNIHLNSGSAKLKIKQLEQLLEAPNELITFAGGDFNFTICQDDTTRVKKKLVNSALLEAWNKFAKRFSR